MADVTSQEARTVLLAQGETGSEALLLLDDLPRIAAHEGVLATETRGLDRGARHELSQDHRPTRSDWN